MAVSFSSVSVATIPVAASILRIRDPVPAAVYRFPPASTAVHPASPATVVMVPRVSILRRRWLDSWPK